LSYPLQIHTVAILEKLHQFFSRNPINLIEFWECSNHLEWHLHKTVDLETKVSNPTPVYPCKMSWDCSKKIEYNISNFGWKEKLIPWLTWWQLLLYWTILYQGRSLATVIQILKLIDCTCIKSNHKSCSYWRI